MRFARFARGNGGAIVRRLVGLNLDSRLRLGDLLTANAFQRGLNRLFIRRGYRGGGLLMAQFARRFFSLKARLFGVETRFSLLRPLRLLFYGADFRLFLTIILHQRNVARADISARAALDTIEQMVRLGFVMFLAAAKPVELLRQQPCGTGVRAFTAANAGLLRRLFHHFVGGGRQNAVADFDDRHIQRREREAHQRAAHDHHRMRVTGMETGLFQQMAYRRAQPRPNVARLAQCFAG